MSCLPGSLTRRDSNMEKPHLKSLSVKGVPGTEADSLRMGSSSATDSAQAAVISSAALMAAVPRSNPSCTQACVSQALKCLCIACMHACIHDMVVRGEGLTLASFGVHSRTHLV